VPKEDPGLPGDNYKVLDGEGYDDGGVADLTLMLDLDDMVWRRKRGDKAYYEAIRNDLLPRQTVGSMTKYSRRDQKVQLAQVLFGDDPDSSHTEEIYSPPLKGDEDPAVIKQITKNLATAKEALKLSIILEEPACMAMSLVEIAKRILTLKDKEGADDAIRCLEKAIEISSDGFWDLDEIKDEVGKLLLFDLRELSSNFDLYENSGIDDSQSYCQAQRSEKCDKTWLSKSGVFEAHANSRISFVPSIYMAQHGKRMGC